MKPVHGAGRHAIELARSALILVGLVVVCTLILDVGARLTIFVLGDVLGIGLTERKSREPAFEEVAYDPAAVLQDQERAPRPIYAPYVVWRAASYESNTLNVESNGRRVTHYSVSDSSALRVWLFGGSALFGYGAPDWETIPSHLARILKQDLGVAAEVRNYGQGGYVSSQELIALVDALRTGGQPDIVLFYDGYNDAVSARHWPEVPGAHFQLDRVAARFEGGLVPLAQSSGIARVAEYLSLLGGFATERASSPAEVERAVTTAWTAWQRNVRAAVALSEEFNFDVVFFLQPTRPHSVMDALRARLRLETNGVEDDCIDLGNLLANEPNRFFIDSVHVTGAANGRIAEELVTVLCDRQRRVGSTTSSRSSRLQSLRLGCSTRLQAEKEVVDDSE